MATVCLAGLTADGWDPVATALTTAAISGVRGWRRMTAYTSSALAGPVVLDRRRSSEHRCHRAGAGLDLGDVSGGHSGPDDVMAAVVLAADAVKALRVEGVRHADGRNQFRAAGNAGSRPRCTA